ncbi:MAG: transcriptional regulator [Acetomicrobium flavidum]|uniref:transcriptional regulator n=1 Tax=Acetomicrobium flavidum TaxID=49896 RepID=UPI0016A8CDCB|nr:transcriptional regulator [Acetomicrobium flavidum]
MKYYKPLLRKGCFTRHNVVKMSGNQNTASSIIRNYLKKGYIQSVKRNLYVAVDLIDDEPIVNRYVIASSLTDSAYISHHTALAYYGYANQVFYDVYVSSEKRFHDFEFGGFTYRYVMPRLDIGVVEKPDGVKVTDLERTIIDSINDFERIGGLEELLRCLEIIPYVNEAKLLMYLKCYNKQILFQKTGYILEYFKDSLKLSDAFFKTCAAAIAKSVRYLYRGLDKENATYNKRWRLIVPTNLMAIISEGVGEFAWLR